MNKTRTKRINHLLALLQSRLFVGRILKTIDLDRFKVYQERYRDSDPRPHGYSKYLDIRKWLQVSLAHAFLLGLHNSKPLRILDIGTGAGYFPYICSFYGHRVVALDLDAVPMYNDLIGFLKVDRRVHRVEKFQPLPDLGMKFELVTAFMIKFNRHYEPDQWGVDEWRSMIEDLKANQLVENGRIFISFNSNLDGTYYDQKMLNYFLSLGARVRGREVDIGGPKLPLILDLLDRPWELISEGSKRNPY